MNDNANEGMIVETKLQMMDGPLVKAMPPGTAPDAPGQFGNLFVGAAHVPMLGPALHLAFQAPTGEFVMVAFDGQSTIEFCQLLQEWLGRLASGEFDKPAVKS